MKLNIIAFLFFGLVAFGQSLNELRSNYTKAVNDKSVCEQMIKQLENNHKTPLYQAYLGAYQTIWANHVINPISKLNTFKKGKNNLENAIQLDQNLVEIRFLRYSIQKNAPQFLGYSKQLKEDETFLRNHLKNVQSPELSNAIKSILK